MRSAGLLGLALLAAFVVFCFARESGPRPAGEAPQRARRPIGGDGDARRPGGARTSRTHVHEGDPSVRH